MLTESGSIGTVVWPCRGETPMLDMIKPAAQDSYAAYIEHLKRCPECPKLRKRCEQAEALVQAYLADLRQP